MPVSSFEEAWTFAKQFGRDLIPDDTEMDESGRVLADLYAGAGGTSEGWRQAGLPVAYAADAWDHPDIDWAQLPMEQHRVNHPEAVHDRVVFGDAETGGSAEQVASNILDAVDGREYHYHASPPCPNFSRAKSNRRSIEDLSRGMEQTMFALDVWRRLRESGHAPASGSMENVPGVKRALNMDNAPWGELPIPEARQWANEQPQQFVRDFGGPQHRGRTIIGEGWRTQPTHRGNPRTAADFLPHLYEEEDDTREYKREHLAALLERGSITPEVFDLLMQQPQLNMEDSLHPGKGPRGRPDLGAVWNDERKSRVFNHTLPLNRTLSALTHDIPVHAWNRRLTPSEAGMLQGFRGDYNWQPAIDAGRYRPNLSKPKSQSVVGTMIGNAVSPFVSRAIARGLMKKSASNQLTLSQWY